MAAHSEREYRKVLARGCSAAPLGKSEEATLRASWSVSNVQNLHMAGPDADGPYGYPRHQVRSESATSKPSIWCGPARPRTCRCACATPITFGSPERRLGFSTRAFRFTRKPISTRPLRNADRAIRVCQGDKPAERFTQGSNFNCSYLARSGYFFRLTVLT